MSYHGYLKQRIVFLKAEIQRIEEISQGDLRSIKDELYRLQRLEFAEDITENDVPNQTTKLLQE